MQYVLTQTEMDVLTEKNDLAKQLPPVEKLQKFCSFVADNLVLTTGWQAGHTWGCILTEPRNTEYCDECPSKDICPNPWKQWSK